MSAISLPVMGTIHHQTNGLYPCHLSVRSVLKSLTLIAQRSVFVTTMVCTLLRHKYRCKSLIGNLERCTQDLRS